MNETFRCSMCQQITDSTLTVMRQWSAIADEGDVAICVTCNNQLAASEYPCEYAQPISDETPTLEDGEIYTQGHKVSVMANELYHSHPSISNTDLGHIGKSIKHWQHKKMTPHESTPAFVIGGAFHDSALQPELFNSEYVCAPKCDRRTKVGKEEYAKFTEESKGKTILTVDQWDLVTNMINSILQNDQINQLLAYGLKEESYFWTDRETGVECKCRPDIMVMIDENGNFINPADKDALERWVSTELYDFKTCADASKNEFQSSLGKWSYDRQAAHYSRGVQQVTGKPVDDFVFIPVEKNAPYDFAFYNIDETSLDVGKELVERSLYKLATYFKTPSEEQGDIGLDKSIQTISLPLYKLDADRR